MYPVVNYGFFNSLYLAVVPRYVVCTPRTSATSSLTCYTSDPCLQVQAVNSWQR